MHKKKKKKKKKMLNANRKTKQVRKPSYTHEEITVLPEEVATKKAIIQSTLNSAEVTGQQKGQLWASCGRISQEKEAAAVCAFEHQTKFVKS